MLYKTCLRLPCCKNYASFVSFKARYFRESSKICINYPQSPYTFFHKYHTTMTTKVNDQLKLHYRNASGNLIRPKEASDYNEKKAFSDIFPAILEVFTKHLVERNLHEVANWFTEVLQYNVPHGKQNRGMTVVNCYKMLVLDASDEQLHIARIVGWCMELAQAYLLIADDIMDESVTRRGQPCWYKQENVGWKAINDLLMINAAIFKVLYHFIENREDRLSIADCFNDVIWHTTCGECLDLLSEQKGGRPDLNKYSYDLYTLIIKYKTSYYSICLPVHLAMVLAGKKQSYTSSVEELLFNMGHFLQFQDDYLDCFGDPKITGKIGTDIEDGKCCWMILTALERVNSEDRKILESNYGVQDGKCVQRVRDIYEKIGLKEIYLKYETEAYENLCRQIEVVCNESQIPEEIFFEMVNKIYKRNK